MALEGYAQATFTNDTFEQCSSVAGGAIYGTDFESLVVDSCSFTGNVAFSGRGENVFA